MAFAIGIANKERVSTSGTFNVFVECDTDMLIWGYEVQSSRGVALAQTPIAMLLSLNKSRHICNYTDSLIYEQTMLSTYNIVTDLINALPGNSSVNTVQHATIDEAVFSMSSAPRPVLVTDQWTHSLTRDTCFLCGLRHATIEGLYFLCVVLLQKNLRWNFRCL
jgi:hypothetical protein